ncbi:MAG: N-acetyltransferase [Rhodobacteraceae bacterium]|nr:MAG: N-acetyltransferase [Paracoccaceae bacterium]
MNTMFVTNNQKAHLAAALELTGSKGFMEDARAVAAYKPGAEGDVDKITSVAVFECFRGGRAELHFGMADGLPLTKELVTATVYLAFHPKAFDLDRLLVRVPCHNTRALIALIKIGFQIEYRDRASLVDGADGIVMSLDRETVIKATAALQPENADEAD